MSKILNLLLVLVCGNLTAGAQFTEHFSDGDFTANPAWTGNTGDFVVNASMQLQSNNMVPNAGFYLSTTSTKATTAQWDFYCQASFNPSSTNYIDVYLNASASDLTTSFLTGYFVRIGNTNDEICLYRKDAAGIVKIIDGVDGVLNTSNNTMKIKVVRNAAHQWTLSRDLTATGAGFFSEGTVTDATYITSAFFGIYIKQSTASFFQRHFFDDIEVKDFVPDMTPPVLLSATASTNTMLEVLFDESVDPASSQVATNYLVNNAVGAPLSATRDATNNALVHLTFATPFPGRVALQLTVNGVKDLAGNTLNGGTTHFSVFTPMPNDIVIDEIMADPTPVVGLPDAEWIELHNTSGFDINLAGWRLGKSSGQSGPLPAYLLKKDSFVVITTGSAVALLSTFTPTIPVTSFPSLGNTGDLLYLRSPQGLVIHSVNYSDAWYQNELKNAGGWTLEMKDTRNPCTGMGNWAASSAAAGGTPGRKNSIDGVNPDATAPRLVRAYAADSIHVVLVFSEPLDSLKASLASRYLVSDGIGTAAFAVPQAFLFNRVSLRLANPFMRNKIYSITATGILDCSGNAIGNNNTARVGLFESLQKYDVVVNEILFNPVPASNDYVEIYNRSNKIISLRNAYLANRNTAGIISSITQVSAEDYLFFPGDYLVLTENATLVKNQFVANSPGAFIEINMPSYNDDKGNVILLNEQGVVIDEINYTDKWHFKLISNKEGVALERINYNDTTADNLQTPTINEQAANWHSAASSVGYGTPTYKNSQYLMDAGVQGEITVTPEVISPDNDGRDDFATINYIFPEPGYVANITIFDANGRPVRYLQRNALNGVKGFYRWDGLDEKSHALPAGIYIIYTEVFNLQGKTKKFKNVVVLAKKH